MSDQKNVFKYTDVKMKNIIYSESVKTKSEEFVFCKIWYKDNKQVQTFNIQTPYFKIHEVADDKNSVILLPEKELEMFFDNLDSLTIDFIKSNIMSTHNIKGISYRTIVNEIPNMNVFRAKFGSKQKPTQFYLSKSKTRINYDETIKILDHCEKVKLILEIDGLIIDFNKKIMYTNVIVRQMLISEMEPKRIELETHSFIESGSDNEQADNDQIEKEFVMNLQIEDDNAEKHQVETQYVPCILPTSAQENVPCILPTNAQENVSDNVHSDIVCDTNETNSIILKESDNEEEEKPKPKAKRGRKPKLH
jgi:hypothetical protein